MVSLRGLDLRRYVRTKEEQIEHLLALVELARKVLRALPGGRVTAAILREELRSLDSTRGDR